MITLFAEPPRSSAFPTTFVVSILLHASLLSLLTLKVLQTHRVIERFPLDHFALHVLDLHSKEPQTRQSAGGGIVYRGPKTDSSAASETASQTGLYTSPNPVPQSQSAAPSSGSPAPVRQTPRLLPAKQTLVQPDLPKNLVIPDKTPVPLLVLWSADSAPRPKIVPPPPSKPAIAVVQPNLDIPIPEEKLADFKVASRVPVNPIPAPVAGTTSPIVVHGPEAAKKVPETTSKQPEPPTPARVIALSDVRVPEGKVAVPVANQASSKAPPGSLIPGVLKSPSPSGSGDSAAKSTHTAAGKGAGDNPASKGDSQTLSASTAAHAPGGGSAGKPANSGAAKSPAGQGTAGQGSANHAASPAGGAGTGEKAAVTGRAGSQTGAAIAPADGAASGSFAGNPTAQTHISLPKDGQFGVVVVGSSIEDKYPETAELWSGRLASTVYLHVGLAKSWILQYALPRLADASSVSGGRLEAPWPFEIVRPNLNSDGLDSDAVILHGYVNKDGRFEKLEVVFPPQFPQSQMVVNVIGQWQFRPARLNGQFIPVEVLLIIPDQGD